MLALWTVLGKTEISVINVLLNISIFLVPFYDVLFRMYPYISLAVDGTRPQRDIISLWLAVVLALWGLYQGKMSAREEKPLLVFLLFIFVCSFTFSNRISFTINNVSADSFWLWRPMFYVLVYFLAYLSITNSTLTPQNRFRILKNISLSVLIMAVYIGLQALGVEQFFGIEPYFIGRLPSANMGGTLGQPTIVAPWIALGIPIMLYLKQNKRAFFCFCILVLLRSQVALTASVISLGVYHILRKPKAVYAWAFLFLLVGVYLILHPNSTTDSGRFHVWRLIVQDWKTSPFNTQSFAITGAGIGSFQYTFHKIHNSIFYQAHNEYLEVLYWGGVIGLSLFVYVLYDMFRRALKTCHSYTDYRQTQSVALTSSFLCICLCAGGTFVWQLGVYRIITIIILGLLNQRSDTSERRFIKSS